MHKLVWIFLVLVLMPIASAIEDTENIIEVNLGDCIENYQIEIFDTYEYMGSNLFRVTREYGVKSNENISVFMPTKYTFEKYRNNFVFDYYQKNFYENRTYTHFKYIGAEYDDNDNVFIQLPNVDLSEKYAKEEYFISNLLKYDGPEILNQANDFWFPFDKYQLNITIPRTNYYIKYGARFDIPWMFEVDTKNKYIVGPCINKVPVTSHSIEGNETREGTMVTFSSMLSYIYALDASKEGNKIVILPSASLPSSSEPIIGNMREDINFEFTFTRNRLFYLIFFVGLISMFFACKELLKTKEKKYGYYYVTIWFFQEGLIALQSGLRPAHITLFDLTIFILPVWVVFKLVKKSMKWIYKQKDHIKNQAQKFYLWLKSSATRLFNYLFCEKDK